MKIEEAIRVLNDIYDWGIAPDLEKKVEANIPKIIELLQRGEKYKQMWGELEIKLIKGYFINHSIKLENCKELYKELRNFIEQKYFPKEK